AHAQPVGPEVADSKQRDPSEEAASAEAAETISGAVRRVLNELPAEMKRVIEAVLKDGLSYADAIEREQVRVSEPAARQWMKRFRDRLRQELGDEYATGGGCRHDDA